MDIEMRKLKVQDEDEAFKNYMPPERQMEKIDSEFSTSFSKFVEDEIAKMQKFLITGSYNNITFDELNNALANYTNIQITLISIYNIAKDELIIEKENFDDWYAITFSKERDILNPREVKSSMWRSSTEVGYKVIENNRVEYRRRKMKLNEAELKVAFFRRLLDSWGTYQWVLSTMSKNIQSELSGTNVQDRVLKNAY